MRIIAGSARGRTLQTPKDDRIRPTSDRVRQAIFDVLGQWMTDLSVLDLFAGTGALALEALSRGATRAVLVDADRDAIALCRANAEQLGFVDRCRILPMPAARALEQLKRQGETFQLIFADPPYRERVTSELLEALTAASVVAPEGIVLIEHDHRETAPENHAGFSRSDERRFGDTVVSFYRHS